MPLLLSAQIALAWGEASDGVAMGVGQSEQTARVST
jgi:hypothetical protein